MSNKIEDKIEYYPFDDLKVELLCDFYSDMNDLYEFCDDMVNLYKKEECCTLGSEKYSTLIEDEVFLIEDIASAACKILQQHGTVIKAFRQCREKRESKKREQTKPRKE
ncbi:hypothetical protein EHI8A_246170 [Entamoeba histolytica HM-1:IMSS-B]|uniref:Uncharacterized protein n=2 Tax=Entamoeba histolytica (strain ATCC 30459 / HM-1:IMSS / ABRM) TaxID=294381 RepID=M3U254_ENTH1|nr:hypothetical protein EHI8A_246170 [Entamoeba histolytica HM-1:IMSS-B]ENY61507.1 hypothetical protein EHI7A_124240 [Entamoeba histolytica HM-1:IMSS-A]